MMKRSELYSIVKEEVQRFIEMFSAYNNELKQTSTVMPDELKSVIEKASKDNGYGKLDVKKEGDMITFSNAEGVVFEYDKENYTLYHNFYPDSIVDKLK